MSGTPEMIERVATAIMREMNRDELPEGGWTEIAQAAARAAIEAMREPTPAMILARWPTYHPWGQNAPPPEDRQAMFDEMAEKTAALWATMIDAALTA